MIVRADLPRGIQAAHLVHAAGESSPGHLPADTYAVVLAAQNEAHLALVADALVAKGVALVRIHEPDPPWSGSLMAVGLCPARKGVIGRLVSTLPLLR